MSTPATTKWCNRFMLKFYTEDTSDNDKLRIPFIYLSALLFKEIHSADHNHVTYQGKNLSAVGLDCPVSLWIKPVM